MDSCMLSVIIITKNEEPNIRRCLQSVDFADEIIVLDSGSTDRTLDIAREFTDKVFVNTDWQGYGKQKQRALEQAVGDWVLNLDADESVNDALKTAILNVMGANEQDAYQIPICMNFYDRPMPYSSSPSRHIRLFRRRGARYSDDLIHEKIVLPESFCIGKLSQAIMHHSFQDVSHALYKVNRYSSCSATVRLQQGSPPSLLKVLLGTGWMFFRCYIIQRGFMDGRAGFVLAVFKAQGTLYRGIKQIYPDDGLKNTSNSNQSNNWNG
jgi:glycosyltransferase involved in cell wall biosynthesis